MIASVWPRGIGKRHVAQHLLPAERDVQLVQLDERGGRSTFAWSMPFGRHFGLRCRSDPIQSAIRNPHPKSAYSTSGQIMS